MSDLKVIIPQIEGIEANTASEIQSFFEPMLETMKKLDIEFNKLIKLPQSPEVAKKAKALRGKYVKVRTGTAKIHKELKADSLLRGRVIDGWKNAQLLSGKAIEERLMAIEKAEEIAIAEAIETLRLERETILKDWVEFDHILPPALGEMDDKTWDMFLEGCKLAKAARDEAAHQAKIEADILKQQQIDKDKELEKLRQENAERREQEAADTATRIRAEEATKAEEAKSREEEVQAQAEAAADPIAADQLTLAALAAGITLLIENTKAQIMTPQGIKVIQGVESMEKKMRVWTVAQISKLPNIQ